MHWLIIFILVSHPFSSEGCQMDDVNWLVPTVIEINDTQNGVFFSKATTEILGYTSVTQGSQLVRGPYFTVSLVDSVFSISTNEAFAEYEEYETAQSDSVSIVFNCQGGTTEFFAMLINIRDTNNNDPIFQPSDEYVFTVAPPLPPGFHLTDCVNEIIVRDIDLTTQRVNFAIEENAYLEILFDETATNEAKSFQAILRTTSFIRSLPEPLQLRISATDVDLTGDPSRTTYATITINADTDFELPTEPIFNEAFYFADYTEAHTIILEQRISLQQGYDDLVTFALEGDYKEFFNISRNGNELSLLVVTPLSYEDIPERQIFLVVTAEREYTSGASTTVIVKLPEEIPLLFEEAHYEGRIEDNVLFLRPLSLQQGYEGRQIEIQIISDYSSYFSETLEVNVLTLTMLPLDEESLESNNFIALQIIASNGFTSSTTVVNLEIVKDDTLTPVFEQSLYVGTWESENVLNIETITLQQGYDATVLRTLSGEHRDYFTLLEDGPSVTLSQISPLTQDILSESDIILFVDASKPRTVGATAAIKIVLPTTELLTLRFTQNNYVGTLDNNDLEITPISLLGEAPDGITLNVLGEFSAYFQTSGEPSSIQVEQIQDLSPEILERNLIVFDIEASSQDAISGFTTIVIEIIKDMVIPIAPEFEQAYYVGQYSELNGLEFQEIIRLNQGFDSTVNFTTSSDQLEWFQIRIDDNEISLAVPETIPQELLENNDNFILVITAENGFNLKTTTTIIITVQKASSEITVLGFEQANYIGTLEDSILTIDTITLLQGITENVEFTLHGEFEEYFERAPLGSTVTISLLTPIPQELLIAKKFIVLELRATAPQAITATATIVLEVIQSTEIILVSLSEDFYSGQYNSETSVLTFAQEITLTEGNDETVQFELLGDDAQWFELEARENNVQTLVLPSPLPAEVLENRNMLVFVVTATKPGANTARSTIAISVSDSPENTILGFEQPNYVGTLEDSTLNLDSITLLHGYSENVEFTLHGEFQDYFERATFGSTVTISLLTPIPQELLNTNKFIVLELRATAPQAITATATIVLEVIQSTEIILVSLSEDFYSGQYNSETSVLTFAQEITLTEGNDETVQFELLGDDAQWFELEARENNVQTLVLPSPLPAEVLENRNMLVFVVTATKPGANTARSTIAISVSDSPENTILGFEQPNYVGTLEDSTLNLDSITLLHGYSENVEFTLHGEFQDYFEKATFGSTVTISLLTPIPQELLNTNKFIVLELRATAPQAITATATIVLEVIQSTEIILVSLSEDFYSGQYNSETSVLTFAQEITLTEGNDETVQFELLGDDAQWFELEARENNVQTLVLPSPLPAEVLENRNMLVFVVTATKPGANTARSTIAISVSDSPENTILGFEQPNYVGTLEDSTLNLDSITLLHGYSENVEFTLHGEFQDYFEKATFGSTVTISLLTPIPQELLNTNKFIVLELRATAPQAITATATIVLEVIQSTDIILVSLSEDFYSGQYNSTSVLIFAQEITLTEGNDETVQFELLGDDAQWFELEARENNVQTLVLPSPLPAEVLENRNMLVFVVTATKPGANTARSTIAISVSDSPENTILGFEQPNYVGTLEDSTLNLDSITLLHGYSENVEFTLHGEFQDYFEKATFGSTVTISLLTPIPQELLNTNKFIVLELRATAPQAITATATIVLEVIQSTDIILVSLSEDFYSGQYNSETSVLIFAQEITLTEGNDETVQFELLGDDAQWFELEARENNVQTLVLPSPLPAEVLENRNMLVFVVTATKPGANTARSTIAISVSDSPENTILGFEQPNYVGTLEDSTLNLDSITLLHGYSENVEFTLHGEFQEYFERAPLGSTVTITLLTPVPQELLNTKKFIVLELRATAPQAITATATIVLEVIQSTDIILISLSEVFYLGQYNSETNVLSFTQEITLTEGNDETVEFELVGDDAQWFDLEARENNVQTLVMPSPLPNEVLENRNMLVFVVTATKAGANTARSTIAISISASNFQTEEHLVFSETYYRGEYISGQLIFEDTISLVEGYDEMVEFTLDGDGSEYFELVPLEYNNVTLHLPVPLPENVTSYRYVMLFAVVASRPGTRTVKSSIIIRISGDPSIVPAFGQVVFEGVLHVQASDVQHEDITVTNYDGDSVHLIGEYASLFGASAINGFVQIDVATSLTLPSDLKYIILEMQADTASAALVLEVNQDEEYPVIPTVTFTSQAYVFRIDVSVSGIIGRVDASADNGETITYSLMTDNEHLQERLYVNNEGEIHLSAPANSGVYNFEIAATTIFTKETATAAGHITVEVVTVPDCDNDELVMPPLIVLDRGEEEEHQNLVVLNSTRYEGCHFTLNNRWPADQDWLYVDENGLHTRRIDREDPKIAFMGLSQVQVELILECDTSPSRTKRSVNTRYDWLGPYDYGVNKWILTDSILYNSKRSFVNLIVNDINDNAPVFVGTDTAPLVVGYPMSEIENIILPRSLAELQATDADIGENAALFYWTSNDAIAVSPTTGFVHVKDLDLLEDGLELIVFATDQNGQGPNTLTGSITLTVKMLDVSHIAVVTIKDAFLEDEADILRTLSTSVGYDIKLLRSAITSQDVGNSENRRRVRSDTNEIGTSLQLYVYGILNRLPVEVIQLAEDIDANVSTVSVNIVTLEKHLQNLDTCVIPGHDVGLLVSTIVLSILLFILIAAIVVWYFLKWKKNQVRVYEQFSDQNSIASTIESMGEIPKPEPTKPRLNIQELKRSERRLQEMLDAPFDDISVESPKRKEETLVNIPIETHSPIVIQSIDKLKKSEESDDEDEFGKVNRPRKKSVVTFNENVEKIIHVEDIPDSNDKQEYEVYKL